MLSNLPSRMLLVLVYDNLACKYEFAAEMDYAGQSIHLIHGGMVFRPVRS